MKKIWAIACVVGFTAFWTFGFIALSGTFGSRDVGGISFLFCAVGLGVGLVAWFQVAATAPRMHRQRAAARSRLEEEYRQSLG